MGYFYYLWYLLGYEDEADEPPILCLNSFAPTSRGINWVMKRIYFDDEDDDYTTEDEAEIYFKKNYD